MIMVTECYGNYYVNDNSNDVNSSEMIMVMVTLVSMMMVTVISLTIHDDGNSSYGNYYVIT